MIRTYCDKCDGVITEHNPNVVSNRMEFTGPGGFKFQLIAAQGEIWNQGALCEPCVRELFEHAKPMQNKRATGQRPIEEG